MTICFFGNYIKDYPRVEVLRKGLQKNGVHVVECHTRKTGIAKYLELYKQHLKLKNKYNILIVMMGGQSLVWFAKLISNKKIIFDAFSSLYITDIFDRQTCSSKSLKAKYYAWLDKFSANLAGKVLLDTQEQINFYIKKYKINKNKFIRLFVSADNELFFPKSKPNPPNRRTKFVIHWHGYIVPFYSMQTIVESAKILSKHSDIEFHLITRFNSKYEKIKSLVEKLDLKNVKFYPETGREKIAEAINNSNICLGIFGNNKKAQVVIPNKIVEAIACSKPVITADQPAIHELFTDKKDIILCKSENPQDLANKILELKNNSELKNKISENAYQLYKQKLTPEILVKDICQTL
jgi:glycosyltransferase involved in cell wall biosynthesis